MRGAGSAGVPRPAEEGRGAQAWSLEETLNLGKGGVGRGLPVQPRSRAGGLFGFPLRRRCPWRWCCRVGGLCGLQRLQLLLRTRAGGLDWPAGVWRAQLLEEVHKLLEGLVVAVLAALLPAVLPGGLLALLPAALVPLTVAVPVGQVGRGRARWWAGGSASGPGRGRCQPGEGRGRLGGGRGGPGGGGGQMGGGCWPSGGSVRMGGGGRPGGSGGYGGYVGSGGHGEWGGRGDAFVAVCGPAGAMGGG